MPDERFVKNITEILRKTFINNHDISHARLWRASRLVGKRLHSWGDTSAKKKYFEIWVNIFVDVNFTPDRLNLFSVDF